jgi:flagellar biosynthesis GTPase FlhF
MTRDAETRTYRGRTLDELIPRIREELGPEAVIVRQRDGLQGGFGGFFQKQFVEVDAQAGSSQPTFDSYDDEAVAMPPPARRFAPDTSVRDEEARREGMDSPAIQAVVEAAAPFAAPEARPRSVVPAPGVERAFASALEAAQRERSEHDIEGPAEAAASTSVTWMDAPPEPDGAATPGRPGARSRPPAADALEQALVAAGLPAEVAADLVSDTVSHLLPFASARRLKALVRLALAQRIPVLGPPSGPRRVVAFVGAGGAGKTLCAARLGAAYGAGSDLPVTCVALRQRDGGALLTALLGASGVEVSVAPSAAEARTLADAQGAHNLIVVDTPTVSPHDAGAVRTLAADLAALGANETHLTVPATLSAVAARELVEGFAPLGVTALALTHADETAHLGHAVHLAMSTAVPLSYVGRGTAVPEGLAPADPHDLAARLVP